MEKREWLIKARNDLGMSQLDIAKELEITQQAILNWENGLRTPKPKLARKLAKILNFDWTKFYEDSQEAKEEDG